MMRYTVAFVLLVAGAVLFADAARADAVILKDGRIFEGRKMERAEGGVKVHFENGEVLIPDRLIRDAVIEGDVSFTPRTEEEKAKVAKGLVPFDGRWLTPQRRDQEIEKRLAERRAELEALKGLRYWRNRRKETTKHFRFEYNVPPHIFEYYRDMMESYFTEFAKTWKVGQPKEYGRLSVSFYANLSDFHQVGGAGGGVRGYFRFVPPLELNFYYDRADPRYTEEVMFHEANHYLQKLINPDFSMPHFPGESLAEFYGASVYDPQKKKKKLTVGLIQEGRLTEIQTDIAADKWLGIKEMILSAGDYRHYTWGWSFVHFLMNHKKYKKKFEKYVLTLARGKGVKRERAYYGSVSLLSVTAEENLRVLMASLGLKNEAALEKLEKEWRTYVKEKLKLVTARGLEKAAMAAANQWPARPIRAKRLFKEALAAGDLTPSGYNRYAELLEEDGKRGEAITFYRKAVELDPLNARYRATLGKALHREGEEEEGERQMRLALEIDPDDPWLQFDVDSYLEED